MANLILIRHGETECNVNKIANGIKDIPLTCKGIEQGEKTALFLRKMDLENIVLWSSPLSRAINTAKMIGKTLEVGITIKPELIERDFGRYEGTLLSEINWQLDSKEIEPSSSIFGRIAPLLDEIREVEDKTFIMVTHSSIIRHFIYMTIGLDEQISPTNCSITKIIVDDFEMFKDSTFYNYDKHLKNNKDR